MQRQPTLAVSSTTNAKLLGRSRHGFSSRVTHTPGLPVPPCAAIPHKLLPQLQPGPHKTGYVWHELFMWHDQVGDMWRSFAQIEDGGFGVWGLGLAGWGGEQKLVRDAV